MATFPLTIPDAALPRFLDAICTIGGYTAQIPDPNNPGATLPNPQTRAQFARQWVATHLMQLVNQTEIQQAQAAALANVTPPPPIT